MREGQSIHEIIVPADGAGRRLDRVLADVWPHLSRARIQALMASGDVQVDGAPVAATSQKALSGQQIRLVVPEARPAHAQPQAIALDVVYEDDCLIVVNKPAGLVVHPAAGNADGTLVNALLHHCRGQLSGIGGVARPGIVHRIDKDTSGLLVVAKTDAAHQALAGQFAAHSVERIYTAVVAGHPVPPSGTISGALARSSHDRKKIALVAEGRGKPAITHYRTLERLKDAAVVECRLETGRTHQIRVHMASIGHPLAGDPTYGRAGRQGRLKPLLDGLGFHRQALHAGVLGFIHPLTGDTLRFERPLPDDMATLVEALRKPG